MTPEDSEVEISNPMEDNVLVEAPAKGEKVEVKAVTSSKPSEEKVRSNLQARSSQRDARV